MADPDREIWECMLAHLQRHHPALCRQWFTAIQAIGIGDGQVVLRAAADIQRDYLRRECLEAFNDAARAATGSLVAVRFLGPDDLLPPRPQPRPIMPGRHAGERGAAAPASPADTALPREAGLREPARRHSASEADLAAPGTLAINPDYGFENFVIGPTNRLAHAAAIAVSREPGRSYNPLFVHGGVGLGKTHLLQAICVRIKTDRPDTVIHYVSCDTFITDFMNSVQRNQMGEFRHRFRDVDVLVIDDIHFLANRDRTQEEFFHTFNSLYQARKQIVLSSDAPPEEIPDLEDRLVSRFKWGLVAKVDPPSYETRVAILSSKAKVRGIDLPDDVACFIAERINSNIRELEGAVVKVQILAAVDNAPITIALAREALGEAVAPEVIRDPTLEDIITAVCAHYDVKRSEILGKRRHHSISLPRQIGMYLARRKTRHSLEEIGGHFGGRDHTTVLHAVRSVQGRRETDRDLNAVVAQIESRLTSPRPGDR